MGQQENSNTHSSIGWLEISNSCGVLGVDRQLLHRQPPHDYFLFFPTPQKCQRVFKTRHLRMLKTSQGGEQKQPDLEDRCFGEGFREALEVLPRAQVFAAVL